MRFLLSILVLSLFTAAAAPAQIRITRSDLSQDARFGAALLVRDGRVYIGAPGATVGGNVSAGIVYVHDANTGAELGFIRRTFPGANDQFGTALAITQGRLFIGAPGRSGPEYGSVFSTNLPVNGFRFTETDIFAPDAASNEGFGSALAASEGASLYVGAPNGPGGLDTGKIYLFDATDDPPTLFAGPISGGTAGARFGAALAISSSLAAVGAPLHPATGPQSGQIFLDGVPFTPPGLPAVSEFGSSLAASGTLVLAGAPNFEPDPSQNNLGAAYLIDAGSRSVVRRFTPETIFGRFGESVALTPALAAVGASYSNASALEGGAVYLFRTNLRRSESTVTIPIAPRSLGERDHFGDTIATDGTWLAAGAPDTEVAGIEDAGAVYIYDLRAPRPLVKPKPKIATVRGSTAKIKGVAKRGFHAIALVEWSLERNGKYKPLKGTARWRGKVKLKEATRKIFVRAYDAAGTSSKIAVVRIRR